MIIPSFSHMIFIDPCSYLYFDRYSQSGEMRSVKFTVTKLRGYDDRARCWSLRFWASPRRKTWSAAFRDPVTYEPLIVAYANTDNSGNFYRVDLGFGLRTVLTHRQRGSTVVHLNVRAFAILPALRRRRLF